VSNDGSSAAAVVDNRTVGGTVAPQDDPLGPSHHRGWGIFVSLTGEFDLSRDMARPDPVREARRQVSYWTRRRNQIVSAARRGELSWQAADWMLEGYDQEQERRRQEWEAIRAELMGQMSVDG
jgi:hypothetical protein